MVRSPDVANRHHRWAAAGASLLLLWQVGCTERGDRVFELLPPARTGITFANTITTSDSLNVQTDVYIYNGAGVAIGDIDNDGLPDVFLAGNMVSSRLYRNKGQMRFEDITDRAHVGTTRWAAGATMVDINGDGFLDIYVSVSGRESSRPEDRANLLFVNDGNGTFTESAARYGIGDTGFSTHSVFLDYDRDGCVDLFVLNNSPRDFSRGADISHPAGIRTESTGAYNELYRNTCRGAFTNVSARTGILREAGYGLGVVVADFNRDGWPDIYVSNDATPNDVLYVNNGNGAFTNRAGRWLKHSSFAGMGVDAADINDDGWPDILQVDMQPSELSRRKRMSGFMTYNSVKESRRRGFRHDYSVNTLQLSNGTTKDGDVVFSDIASLAGVAATDWSWSPLVADFDNDGHKDIVITNGYPKAVNDFDYQTAMFAVRRGRDERAARRAGTDILAKLHPYNVSNYAFRGSGNLTFTDETKAWGLERPSLSYGAAYADLDNDGRLDLVVNNIDAPAFVYHNVLRGDARHFLQVRLTSPAALGATVTLTAGGKRQHLYYSPYRGYMSSMDDRAHFGLGSAPRVDSLDVTWSDGRRSVLTNLGVDRLVVVKHEDATVPAPPAARPIAPKMFEPLDVRGLKLEHVVATQPDYGIQSLLPYMISRHGPPLAVADVDGDSLEDIFLGGSPASGGGLLLMQRRDGSFVPAASQPWASDKAQEDWGALFFDANGDGRPDLYVASGAYHLAPSSALLQDRLYVSKGGGVFERDVQALPTMLTSTAVVREGDFNGDGRPDLFVGGRLVPRKYPYPTRSYILRNEGGRFTDVTEQVAPDLVSPGGMITDAAWIDYDGDGRLDLVTVGEWMPVQFHHNDGQRLREATRSTGLPPMRGWWFSLTAGDFDKDGRPDLVAGNLGLNYPYRTSRDSPFGVYAGDFTGNQSTDVILTQQIGGKEYPIAGLVPLGREIYSLGLKFPTYGSFADATVADVFTPGALKQALHYQADTFASVFLHNDGGGKFSATPLPNLAQIAPIKAIVSHDVDGDGNLDLIVAGNLYDAEANTTRADAGNGLWLRGDGRKEGHFTPVPPGESGLLAPLNVAGLALLDTPTGLALVVANTGDSLQVFGLRKR